MHGLSYQWPILLILFRFPFMHHRTKVQWFTPTQKRIQRLAISVMRETRRQNADMLWHSLLLDRYVTLKQEPFGKGSHYKTLLRNWDGTEKVKSSRRCV